MDIEREPRHLIVLVVNTTVKSANNLFDSLDINEPIVRRCYNEVRTDTTIYKMRGLSVNSKGIRVDQVIIPKYLKKIMYNAFENIIKPMVGCYHTHIPEEYQILEIE